jgi:hypothetical protein
MLQANPDDRPTASEALACLEATSSTMSRRLLATRLYLKDGCSSWQRVRIFEDFFQVTNFTLIAKVLLMAGVLLCPFVFYVPYTPF